MNDFVKQILSTVEPIEDPTFGPRFRCSLTLKDGTFLPCAVIQSKARLIELAKRRIREEMTGRGIIGGADPFGQIIASFVASKNQVADYSVAAATESKYAIPQSLLSQIHGETTMGWTGRVFKMKDERLFSYGSPFNTVLRTSRWLWVCRRCRSDQSQFSWLEGCARAASARRSAACGVSPGFYFTRARVLHLCC
ncbi:hypothetical protein [Bradyrhizobium guangdongense]|uniref:hypothetical protein n=1 Tax=Bradyrhizobium guangdongense TaxID=1325090 RepID=UPI0011286745|nr:hypothetical protein [Bradyrhizobium guangdongense]